MKKAVLLAAVAGTVLTACNREPEVSLTNASPSEVAAQMDRSGASDMKLQPGRWESEVKLVSVDAPGMPPQALEAMRSAFAGMQRTASCLTPEQAARPAADFFAGGKGQGCTYERFQLGDGKIDSVLQCSGAGPAPSRFTMTGSYSSDNFDMTMTTRTQGPAPAGASAMTMTMQVNSRRTGECNGTERA